MTDGLWGEGFTIDVEIASVISRSGTEKPSLGTSLKFTGQLVL